MSVAVLRASARVAVRASEPSWKERPKQSRGLETESAFDSMEEENWKSGRRGKCLRRRTKIRRSENISSPCYEMRNGFGQE
jgi:hypothetical protein